MKTMKYLIFVTLILFISCSPKDKKENRERLVKFTQFSESVRDTFYIDVQLPNEYFEEPDKHYPVAVLLDGNFFFPMVAPIIHQYENTGLLQPIILISVGYKSFQTMDSLRLRDYMFPEALPSDEIKTIGGGQKFKKYLTQELVPKIDSEYRTERSNRALLGHSFGGYFVLYSLLDQLENKKNDFNTFISASPALWYNNFYLNKLPGLLNNGTRDVNLFISVGRLEDSTWSVSPVEDIAAQIERWDVEGVNFKSRIYNNLGHMDTGVLSFIKGLQELRTEEH